MGEEQSVFIFPKTPGFNLNSTMGPDEIADCPTILFDEDDDGLYGKWFLERFGCLPPEINQRYIVNSHGNMIQAVREGLGVAVVPLHVLRRCRHYGHVGSFEDLKVCNGKFYVVYRAGDIQLPRIQLVFEEIIKSSGPLS